MHRYFAPRAMALACMMLMPNVADAAGEVGVVGALTGSASANSASGARPLAVGEKIFLDEEIVTGSSTKLQLMLNDKSTITLNPNSTMQVKDFAFDPSSKKGNLQVNSLKGAFRFIGGALTKNQTATIKTPVSSIGIRGGIVDGFVQAGTGATETVFNYGEQMTMTNAAGQTVTTTEFGGGFAMKTSTDVPVVITPEQVQHKQEQLNAPAPTSAGDAATAEPAADSAAASDAPAQEGEAKEDQTASGNEQPAQGEQGKGNQGDNNAQQGENKGTASGALPQNSDRGGFGTVGQNAAGREGNGGERGGFGTASQNAASREGGGGFNTAAPVGGNQPAIGANAPQGNDRGGFGGFNSAATGGGNLPAAGAANPAPAGGFGGFGNFGNANTTNSSGVGIPAAGLANGLATTTAIATNPVGGADSVGGGAASPAAGNIAGQAATDGTRFTTVTNLAGGDNNAFNNPDAVRETINTNIQNGANGSTVSETPVQLEGLAVSKNYNGSSVTIDNVSRLNIKQFSSGLRGSREVIAANNASDVGRRSDIVLPKAPEGTTPYRNLTPNANDFIQLPDSNKLYKAMAYVSNSGSTVYYQYTHVANRDANGNPVGLANVGSELSFLVGKPIRDGEEINAINATKMASQVQGTGDVSYYGFTPELTNHTLVNDAYAGQPTADPGSDGIGMFDYGRIDTENQLDEDDAANLTQGKFGMAVNWQKKQFFSGNVNWNHSLANPAPRNVVAFGKVGTNANEHFLKGAVYEAEQVGNAPNFKVVDNDILADEAHVYASPTGVIDALVVQAKDAVSGNDIYQPALRLDASATNGLRNIDTTSRGTAAQPLTVYKGFTAGFGVVDVNAANTAQPRVALLSSKGIDNLTIKTNGTTNTVGAEITVHDVNGANGMSTPVKTTYKFGDAAQPPTAVQKAGSVYLSNDMYAAQHGFTQEQKPELGVYVPGAPVTGLQNNQGFIANAAAIGNSQCLGCTHVHWGVWSASADYGQGVGTNSHDVDVTGLMPYVAGTPTTASELDAYRNNGHMGTVNYTGPIYGALLNNTAGTLERHTGNFSAAIDLGQRGLVGFGGNFANHTITAPGVTAASPIAFTGNNALLNNIPINLENNNNINIDLIGSANAALFGPQAQNIGGNFAASGAGFQATGVFLGAQQ